MAGETDAQLREILALEPIAVVGCSSTPGKDAHEIPKYLVDQGYDVIPVNPTTDEIFGRRSYPSLSAIDREVKLVDVFRPSEELDGIVDEALERDDVDAVWTQLGIRDDEAAQRATDEGICVIQDRCIKVEHRRLFG